MNIAVVDGDSAYNKRHGAEFDGFSIPYGCLVGFSATQHSIEESRKVRNNLCARNLH